MTTFDIIDVEQSAPLGKSDYEILNIKIYLPRATNIETKATFTRQIHNKD